MFVCLKRGKTKDIKMIGSAVCSVYCHIYKMDDFLLISDMDNDDNPSRALCNPNSCEQDASGEGVKEGVEKLYF